MNSIRKYISVMLGIFVLSANGFLFSPVALHQLRGGDRIYALRECCCCNPGSATSGKCCCTANHRTAAKESCFFSTAPCGSPIAALSPNVLDQALTQQGERQPDRTLTAAEEYSTEDAALLSGMDDSLFHPPQQSPSSL